jgi:hypothetical protein
MGWIHETIHCERCGYESALIKKHNAGHWNIILCMRCGYSNEGKFVYSKYESLKNDPEHKDDDDKKLLEQSTECEVIFPSGSYVYRLKGERNFYLKPIEDGSIENILQNLDEYDLCRYTFYKYRSWHIKDLHSNTTTLFSVDEYCRDKDEDDRCRDEDQKREDELTSWGNL